MKSILAIRGFLPFLLMIFLNAFVDLGHKIVIQNTVFKLYDGDTQIVLMALVNGLILLPFIMLFSPAGFVADRFTKPRVMQVAAAVAVGLTLLIALCYYQGWFLAAFIMTLLLGAQSAFYSPAKYGYIQQLSGKAKLTWANGVVQAVTIVAILAGVFLFSWMFEGMLAGQLIDNEGEMLQAVAPLAWLLVGLSLVELLLAFYLPQVVEGDKRQHFEPKAYISGRYLRTHMKSMRGNRVIWLSMVGLSMFWGVSQVALAAFPAFAKQVLNEESTVVIQGIIACAGIGIVLGSLFAGRASRQRIESGLIPLGALGLVMALSWMPSLTEAWTLALAFFTMGLFGGLFIVPLNALIQFHAGERSGAVLAGNNWLQNLTMFAFLGLTMVFALLGLDSRGLFAFIAGVALLGALYTVIKLPQSLILYLLGILMRRAYRVDVAGLDNLPAQGGVLLLGNHISWLDWAIVQLASPRPIRFVMHRHYYQKWYVKWFVDLFGVIPIARGESREALQQVNELLKAGEVVCIFPEGKISHNGQLATFKRGFERTVEGVEGVVVPFYLGGMWGSRFSRCSKNLRALRSSVNRRELQVSFGESMAINSSSVEVKQRVFELSTTSWQRYCDQLEPIPLAWMRSVKRNGRRMALADSQGGELSGYRALTGALLFSRFFEKNSAKKNMGLLLPTSSAGLITNMAALIAGKTVVNLNYTASIDSLLAAVAQAGVTQVYSSRRFLDKLRQRGVVLDALLAQVEVIYLEDLKAKCPPWQSLTTYALVRLLPVAVLKRLFMARMSVEDAAAILFSSGSEAAPKGVVLSHRSLMSNIKQVSDVLDVRHDDVMMGSLPTFHAFGLTVTGLLPLIEGIPVVCHADPTDAYGIAKLIQGHRATLYLGTSTFLRFMLRNRKVKPEMLVSLRRVVAGAERLSSEIREGFMTRFDKEIVEGYGATETGPVASVNIPDLSNERGGIIQQGHRQGSVGLPLPGSSFRIVDPSTLQCLPQGEAGMILIAGPQLFNGYLNNPQKSAEVLLELDGQCWYVTGDKGYLDEDGFLTIVDRYSRFAKIGGEMVSLGAVELAVQQAVDDTEVEVAAVNLPDGRKGERVVLLVSGVQALDDFAKHLRQQLSNPLMIPAQIYAVPMIPKLGSGKSDFTAIKALAVGLSA